MVLIQMTRQAEGRCFYCQLLRAGGSTYSISFNASSVTAIINLVLTDHFIYIYKKRTIPLMWLKKPRVSDGDVDPLDVSLLKHLLHCAVQMHIHLLF